jgi:hypothetical protein
MGQENKDDWHDRAGVEERRRPHREGRKVGEVGEGAACTRAITAYCMFN